MPKELFSHTSPTLLMVDDDEEDIYLTRRAFCAYKTDLVFSSVNDSQNLFDYLYARGKFEQRNKNEDPQVILLDINIPVENGFDIIKKLKADSHFAELPVVMFSTSKTKDDIDKAHNLGAASYITKPVDSRGMNQIAQEFCEFWFGAREVCAVE